MADLLYKDEVYAIVGLALEVYNELGPGFLEGVYQEAMAMEAVERSVPLEPQKEIGIQYKGRALDKFYVADFVYPGKVVVEIKALSHLTQREDAQVLNYLKSTGMQVGLLINFGAYPNLEWKRMVLTKGNKPKPIPQLPEANVPVRGKTIRED